MFKKINNKGFAASIILYTASIIVVLVLLLVLSIVSANSDSTDKIVDTIKEEAAAVK